METVYSWKTGYRGSVSANIAGKELERIDREKGLTAQNVVDESRPADAPLHKVFEWNDTIAGEEWRKQQARVMMGHLLIRVEEETGSAATRAIVKLESSPVYEHINVILAEEDKREAYLKQALKELSSYRQRYKDLVEFAKLFEVIDETLVEMAV